jgi:hypothetical protein
MLLEPDSVVGVVTSLQPGQLGFSCCQRQEILLKKVQASSEAHPAYYSLGIKGSFPGV